MSHSYSHPAELEFPGCLAHGWCVELSLEHVLVSGSNLCGLSLNLLMVLNAFKHTRVARGAPRGAALAGALASAYGTLPGNGVIVFVGCLCYGTGYLCKRLGNYKMYR